MRIPNIHSDHPNFLCHNLLHPGEVEALLEVHNGVVFWVQIPKEIGKVRNAEMKHGINQGKRHLAWIWLGIASSI